MFNNSTNKLQDAAISINRLSALKRADASASREANLSSPGKAGVSFSKALEAVRKEVANSPKKTGNSIPAQSDSDASKPSSSVGSFAEAINARRGQAANPFLKVSPQFQSGVK